MFSKFYRRHSELISKSNVGLKTLFSEGLSESEFYGDLVYKFKKLIGRNYFSFQLKKFLTCYKRIGYNLNVMRKSACLVLTQSWLITMLPSLTRGPEISIVGQLTESVESSFLIHQGDYLDLFVRP